MTKSATVRAANKRAAAERMKAERVIMIANGYRWSSGVWVWRKRKGEKRRAVTA